jgi:hypothetical protein
MFCSLHLLRFDQARRLAGLYEILEKDVSKREKKFADYGSIGRKFNTPRIMCFGFGHKSLFTAI